MTQETSLDDVRRSPGLLRFALLALAVGALVWLLVREPPQSGAPTTDPDVGFDESAEPPPPFELLGSADGSDLHVAFVPTGSSGTRDVQPELHTLIAGELAARPLGVPLPRAGALDAGVSQPGEVLENLLITDAGVVLAIGGRIWFYSIDRVSESAIDLGEGFSLLPGPTPNQVWLLGLTRTDVRLVDLRGARVGEGTTRFELSGIGRAIDSAGAGLILAPPDGPVDGEYLLWTPAGSTQFEGTRRLDYLGSGGDRVLFTGAAVGLVLDLDDPSIPGRAIVLPGDPIHRASVSTDGSHVALAVRTPSDEPDWVSIVDLDTAREINRIDNAVPSGFRWSGPDTLVHVRPDEDAIVVAERVVLEGVDRNLIRFAEHDWRIALSQRP